MYLVYRASYPLWFYPEQQWVGWLEYDGRVLTCEYGIWIHAKAVVGSVEEALLWLAEAMEEGGGRVRENEWGGWEAAVGCNNL